MTVTTLPSSRVAARRHYLMCPPTFFDVTYSINPWMHPSVPVDTALAVAQWTTLVETYERLGHRVSLVDPVPGLPDMVFAANGGLVVDGVAVAARFRHEQRAAEAAHYARALAGLGFTSPYEPTRVNEGEGDFLTVGGVILSGSGFRSDPLAGAEVQEHLGVPVVGLTLVDPDYYHLDTALAVLADDLVAYLPEAFSPGSRQVIEHLFPGAIRVGADDAAVLGLNAVSDGRHVVVASRAETFAHQLREHGFVPVPVDLSELLKSGGGAKCCTMELRPARMPVAVTA